MLSEAPEAPRAPAKPAAEQDLTWDAYLSGGRKAEAEPPRAAPADDDQWSEPFRMLLRGDAPPDAKPPKR